LIHTNIKNQSLETDGNDGQHH
ncbi:hypothetical protein CMV_008990, partial [Castanea mollissima]